MPILLVLTGMSARAVAAELRVRSLSMRRAHLPKPHTEKAEAHSDGYRIVAASAIDALFIIAPLGLP